MKEIHKRRGSFFIGDLLDIYLLRNTNTVAPVRKECCKIKKWIQT